MSDASQPSSGGGGGQRPGRCPICGQPAVERCRPFCSKRCADIDLGRWLGERYRVPSEEAPDDAAALHEDEDSPAKPPRS
jgi:uncharacterized protein